MLNYLYKMHSLEKISERLLAVTETDIRRYLYPEINFDARLIVITGCRGVGKTTLLKQYLKENSNTKTAIYFSLDHLYFSKNTLLETVEELYDRGYRRFGIDEVHKYEGWSRELKNIYDSLPDVKVLVTSSSALDVMEGVGDLSRRADVYNLKGLSFREFLIFEGMESFPVISIDELTVNHTEIAQELLTKHPELTKKFKNYLRNGYYPFYKEAGRKYNDRLQAMINQVIEVDLPPIFNIDYTSVRQIKKLLGLLSELVPYSPNIQKISDQLNIPRQRVLVFLDYLDRADVLNALKAPQKSDSALTKPDKVFLENSNLIHALAMTEPNTGTERETFFMNAVGAKNTLSFPVRGDFMVNDKYVFEVGGKNKSMHQIYGMPNAFLAKDGIDEGYGSTIPLWLFGFGY